MQKNYSIVEAKNKLPTIINSIEEGPPVRLTKHGTPVAVLLSIQEFKRLTKEKHGFWNALKRFRETLTKEGVRISDMDLDNLRAPSYSRKIDLSK